MINIDSASVAYKANDSNVKIYLEADSGVHKSSHEFDRVSRVLQSNYTLFVKLQSLSVI